RLQCDGALRSPQYARGDVDIPIIERRIDLVDTNLSRCKLVRIQLNVDSIFCSSPHLDLRNAPDGRKTLCNQSLSIFIYSGEREGGRGQRELEDRLVRWIDLPDRWRRRHVLRQQPACL